MSKDKWEKKGSKAYWNINIKGDFSTFRYERSTSNCKVYFLSFLGGCLEVDPDITIEAMKKELDRVTFFVHLMNKKHIELLNEHFIQIYCNEVPIRHGEGIQYHALYFSDRDTPQKLAFIKENGLENKK